MVAQHHASWFCAMSNCNKKLLLYTNCWTFEGPFMRGFFPLLREIIFSSCDVEFPSHIRQNGRCFLACIFFLGNLTSTWLLDSIINIDAMPPCRVKKTWMPFNPCPCRVFKLWGRNLNKKCQKNKEETVASNLLISDLFGSWNLHVPNVCFRAQQSFVLALGDEFGAGKPCGWCNTPQFLSVDSGTISVKNLR